MFINKKFQLTYRLLYVILLAAGLTMDLLSWVGEPHNEFLVYYTTQSNLLCLIVMGLLTYFTAKDIKNGATLGRSDHLVKAQFLTACYILITCLIYNLLLGNPFSVSYWTKNSYNWIVHLAGPLLFIADFFMFSERGRLSYRTPLYIMIYPYLYVAFIMIRSFVLNSIYHGMIPKGYIVYPYFFLDLNSLGAGGLLMWIGILTVVFVTLAYVFYGLYNYHSKANAALS